ncbi:hypothetical protein [Companilactobacillus mishanensis]|uniref:Matrixin family metalloprotease n=1 Tax=Companilactobacillus mishanensis TaxID=2486008 RepID=A0A5P0ZJ04_9LACO|nr:hypothetical protein [Companilactobacillus mishanensis]MQS53018.1 hypothetical protein [Companilactobacillus mishanensis]
MKKIFYIALLTSLLFSGITLPTISYISQASNDNGGYNQQNNSEETIDTNGISQSDEKSSDSEYVKNNMKTVKTDHVDYLGRPTDDVDYAFNAVMQGTRPYSDLVKRGDHWYRPVPMPQTGGSTSDLGLADKSDIRVYCNAREVGKNVYNSLQTAIRNWTNSLGRNYVGFQMVSDKSNANLVISDESLKSESKEDGYTSLTDFAWETTPNQYAAYNHAQIQLSSYVKALNSNDKVQVHVLMHEIGHVLGFVDLSEVTTYRNNGVDYEYNTENDVMYGKTNSCVTVTPREVMEFQVLSKAIRNR